ncbi:MAG: type VI secretion system baseplate subunit TssK [Desulfotalea sp.]
MYQKKPLFWHQGLFLQPQHFQQSALHQQDRLNTLRYYGHPYSWGVTSFSIRKQPLESKVFEVKNIEIMFEDGNFVSFPENAILKPRSFDTAWEDRGKSFTVYIGLKRWNDVGGNATVEDRDSEQNSNTMFSVSPDPEELPDLLGGGPVGQIKPMHYVLRLFWETEIEDLGSYHLIPLARLEMIGDQVRIDETFVPPLLTMRASDYLLGLFRDVSEQMAARGRRIEQYKNSSNAKDTLDLSSTIFLLALRSLNRYIPQLKHLTLAPHLHPWDVFGLLTQIVGELSSFSSDITALGESPKGEKIVPDYDHQNPGPCFSAAVKVISDILDKLTLGPEFIGKFIFDDTFFSVTIPKRAFAANNSFWLLVQSNDSGAIVDEIVNIAKLSATKGMSVLLARAVHGVSLSLVENPPPGIPQSSNGLCFSIDIESPLWAEVESTGNLSLYWDGAPPEIIANLVVLRG